MIVTLHPEADAALVKKSLTGLGLWIRPMNNADGMTHSILVQPSSAAVDPSSIAELDGVVGVLTAESQHPLLDQSRQQTVEIGSIRVGTDESPLLIAGPCGLDDEDAVHCIASEVAGAGATMLRGGAFKPRTSPYSFSGYGAVALRWMRDAANQHGLGVVSELLSEKDADAVAQHVDMLQIGSRNMQNFALLKTAGALGLPVLLKRGRAATIEEWLLAAEHLYHAGSGPVVFCERGVRGFDSETRNLLDLAAVAILSHDYGLPVIVDPSHGCGRRDLVVPLSHAAIAAGAHGVMVEVNPNPERALSDGAQAISPTALRDLSRRIGLRGDVQ